jgi:hypothetical protein
MNTVRVSKLGDVLDCPIKPSTAYKWAHLGKYPQLFIKFGGILLLDLDKMGELLESKRLSKLQKRSSPGRTSNEKTDRARSL